MKINNLLQNSRHKSCLFLLALALGGIPHQMNASPIEHIGDRYILHVPELDLRGDESLMDILMMCPDVITLDGKTALGGDPLANLYHKYVIRFDNVEYGLDYNTLLHNLKAREIEKIQVCLHADVMKGSGSQKKVIDIQLRKDVGDVKGLQGSYYAEGNNGKGASGEKISGRQGFFGDTYGGAESITSVRYHGDKLRILAHLEGNMQRSSIPVSAGSSLASSNASLDSYQTNHRSHEGAKVNMIWDISPNDNLEITATQTYTRNHLSGNPTDYERFYNVELDYLRTLSKNGATMLFTIATDHLNDNGGTSVISGEQDRATAYRDHNTYPYAILEFSYPLFTNNLWITTGFEGGLSFMKDCLSHHTDHSNYEDFYAQADLTLGKWGLMVGDRFRLSDSQHYNAYTLSAYHHFNEHRTLQATFGQEFYNEVWQNEDQKPVYFAELKHTYTQKKLMLSTLIRYIGQDTYEGKVKTYQFGNTLFWHIGMLRLTAGISSYKEEFKKSEIHPQNQEDDNKIHVSDGTGTNGSYEKVNSQYFVFKLAPQLSLPYEWRLTSTLLWSTHRSKESLAYAPANLYAEAAVYKTLGRHWLLEARYHDIASQHMGNRAATFGCTYYF